MASFSPHYILKPVGRTCNNICTYCYYSENRKQQAIDREKMSLQFAKKIIRDISKNEQGNNSKVRRIIWHGGEPLLAGIHFYKEIFNYQKKFKTSFLNSFQTNGELITQEWCDLFKEYKCSVGFSMDGPPKIHDLQRKDKNGFKTSHKVLNGIKLCRENRINFGVLCVVTDLSSKYPKSILNYFQSRGIKTFDFLPSCNHDKKAVLYSPLSINPHKFSTFMKKIFDYYLEKDDPKINIRTISNVMLRLFGGRANICNMQGNTCGTFLTIYPDGKVTLCDDYDCGIFESLGNIKNESISQIIRGDRFKNARKFVNNRLKKCKNCEVLMVCNGGCPRHWNEKESYFCPYYKDFYHYCYEKILQINHIKR